MRNVVIVDDVREARIHPKQLMQTFARLLKQDVAAFLRHQPSLRTVPCPGCQSQQRDLAFKKLGLVYQQCRKCLSIYLSPRPTPESLLHFYDTSKALHFWNEDFIHKTFSTRDAHIFLPRVDWLTSTVRHTYSSPVSYADIQPKYGSILKRFAECGLFNSFYAFDVSSRWRRTVEDLGYTAVENGLTGAAAPSIQAAVVTAFEVIESVFDTRNLVSQVNRVMPENGLFFLTTRAASGFDLQILWEHMENVFPMIHNNLLSVEGIEHLLRQSGFEILELSTPGQLDVEIVREAIQANKRIPLPRFISYLMRCRFGPAHQAFQEFLQQYKLSSHLRVVARKISLSNKGESR